MNACPCNSGRDYKACCEPFLKAETLPPTAEALMRSRYTAYVVKNIDYIEKTHHPKQGGDFDREAAQKWSETAKWLGLEVVATEGGGQNDASGEVEFVARFEIDGKSFDHHERSLFKREEGRWYYWDGKIVQKPFMREEPKVGRNDPCACGSGKKAKKCCGAK